MPNEGGDAGKKLLGGNQERGLLYVLGAPRVIPTVLLLLFEGRGTSSFLIVSCGSLVACTAT